ncbi:MAG: minichromosome maintenance protein MCM [Thermoplasmata archaeon]
MPVPFTKETLLAKWEEFFVEYDYKPKITKVVDIYPSERSIIVSYEEIDRYDSELAEYLLDHPSKAIYAAEKTIASLMPPDKKVPIRFRVRGLPANISKIPIKNLRSAHQGKFVAIEGLVRSASEVRPKVQEGIFECTRCHTFHKIQQLEMDLKEPLECSKENGGCGKIPPATRFKLITEDSKFTDTQSIGIQESPEGLRGGEQPQSLTAYAEDDVASIVSPGDRVVINGILRSHVHVSGLRKLTRFDIFLDVNSIEPIEQEFEEISISPAEEKAIKKLSRDPDCYDKIIHSIAPTIYGMDVEKSALALQLFGGVPKEMPDKTRIRGDIHVILVGDPGTAKSQLLRYISDLAPRGIYASGKSSSAAGLTAAAVKDTSPWGGGRWTLEAGALVMADHGVACIDEMDKMTEQDRSALHEAMEQQTISVAKAGITASLHARCSLLAAANPKFGRFEENKSIADQIDLPPALLSRFDIIFSIRDKPNEAIDGELAEHVLKAHLFGEIKKHRALKGDEKFKEKDEIESATGVMPVIDRELLRKYVAYAKKNVIPVMTPDTLEKIKETYVNIRKRGGGENTPVPITPRYLEGFVRLAEASAKARLSDEVAIEDVNRADDIIVKYMNRIAMSETGVWDIDMITSGISHSQRDIISKIYDIIKDLCKKSKESGGEGVAPRNDIINAAEEAGMPRSKIEENLNRLLRDGSIYEPKSGGGYRRTSE